ncbi:short chain dehydrogenase/reductase family oxidoreductase [Hyphomonas adhaerens MHS-3]|uniref:Short chain dehydrogenase/reductase family oxidoreductase n=1 Tax=Hyphomonas adhaerens MHS-3 TaxID=1280949 RepID=A0A069E0F7_9PROT|nr:SDR family oxidoreductase [Hyphomonas adhaerens]KCZ82799.1 short chain dehydrogenase/reductase family oxidoreductase [Hyphomonas adhaerens MHS-3]
MGRLAGKTALITAAGAGIGRAAAEAFAREGAHVIATDIDVQPLSDVAWETGITCEPLDVTDRNAIREVCGRHKDLDILFNVAGWVHHGNIEACDRDDWDRSVLINLTSMYEMSRAVLPNMLAKGGGVILNMSSVASSVSGVANRFAYGATKAGVIGLTKAIAEDYVSRNIRCNAICPGTVDTPSLQGRMKALGNYEEARRMFVERQPMGRLGEADEIANLAVYLASDESSFTTGAVHVIDGGWTN